MKLIPLLFACLQQVAPPAAAPQVLVVATPHLRQIDPDSVPIDVARVRRGITRYRPDHLAIEWLHPSIDPATTFNYRPLGDRATLARLWGITPARAQERRDSLEALVVELKRAGAPPRVLASARVELGRVLYVQGEQAAAAYQWWQAELSGVPVADERRLTSNHLNGHEAAEFGFAALSAAGSERITPFDYQGAAARPEAWGEMLDSLRAYAILEVHDKRASDPGWKLLADSFTVQRQRFEQGTDSSWLRHYGRLGPVREYASVLAGFAWAERQRPRDASVDAMSWWQGAAYEAVERRVQLELIGGIRFGGFGARRLEGITERNRRMVEFLDADVRKWGSRRVLVIVGSQHKFMLEEMLREKGYEIVPSTGYVGR